MNRLSKMLYLPLLIFMSSGAGFAAERIAVVDFELNDITSLPNTPAERQRTATMAPLLSEAIARFGGYEVVPVNAAVLKSVNAGLGYLFRFDDLAAELGRRMGADWIIIGQHSKPSYLYSYLMAHLVEVNTTSLNASFDIELKGNHETVTRRGIDRLANKIRESIERRRSDAGRKPDA